MFHSATLKLTGWYLLILMLISIVFSVVIFNITAHEVGTRLEHLETSLQRTPGFIGGPPPTNTARTIETRDASTTIGLELIYANVCILILGGLGSYFLARRTLRPIEQAHEAQSRFTSDASHELRTPLAVMKTELEVALRDPNSSVDELRDILTSNLEEVEKLSQLSEMLLSLSRLDHDNLELQPTDIVETTREAMARFSLPADRIQLKAPTRLAVMANQPALRELVCILLDNALKYSPADSLVSIVLTKQTPYARFEITNTGPGIAPEKLPYIFDRFYRADSSRTSGEQKGYGLGLALAKKIVELHNGELSVTSEIGHRTSFTVLLPLSR